MILTFLLRSLSETINWFRELLPDATTLPWGTDQILLDGIAYLNFFTTVLPPLQTLLTAFIVYMGFLLALKVINLIPIIRNILN